MGVKCKYDDHHNDSSNYNNNKKIPYANEPFI